MILSSKGLKYINFFIILNFKMFFFFIFWILLNVIIFVIEFDYRFGEFINKKVIFYLLFFLNY